jgi:O-acetylhomoserine (thiol)-lyase
VTTPQLYGATYTYFAAVLPGEGVEARFAADDSAEAIEALIDDGTPRPYFCESIGNPAGNVVDIEAVAEAAHRHGVPLIVDNTVATPLCLKPFRARGRHRHPLADQVRGRPRHDARGHRHRRRPVPLGRAPRALPHVQPARAGVPRRGVRPGLPGPALRRARPHRGAAQRGRRSRPAKRLFAVAGTGDLSVRLERQQQNARLVAEHLLCAPPGLLGALPGFDDNPYHLLAKKYLGGPLPFDSDLRNGRWLTRPASGSSTA